MGEWKVLLEDAGTIGVFCIFAFLVIKEILRVFPKKKNGNGNVKVCWMGSEYAEKKVISPLMEQKQTLTEMKMEMGRLIEQNKQLDSRCSQNARVLEELYKLHDVKDGDGVPIWYVKQSLESAIEKLADNIGRQTEVFRELVYELRGITPNKIKENLK